MKNIFTILLVCRSLFVFSQHAVVAPPPDNGYDGGAKQRMILLCDADLPICKAETEYVFTNDQPFVKYVNDYFQLEIVDSKSEKALQYRMKYRIMSYPVVLITEDNGRLIRKIHGFKSGAELKHMSGPLSKNTRTGHAITPDIMGDYAPFYREYVEKGNEVGFDTMVVRSFVSAFTDINSEAIWNNYALFYPVLASANERLLMNPDQLRSTIGWEEVDQVFVSLLTYIADTITNNNVDYFDNTIMPVMNRMNFESTSFIKNEVSAHFMVYRKQWSKAGGFIQEYMRDTAKYQFKNDSVNAWCNFIYYHCADKKTLETAEKAMKYLPFLSSRSDFMATYGLLLFKTGKWYEAETNLRKAMDYPLLLTGQESEINRVLSLIEAQKKKKKK